MLLASPNNTDLKKKKSSTTGFQDNLATVIHSNVQVFMGEVVHCGFVVGFVLSPCSICGDCIFICFNAIPNTEERYKTSLRNGIMI